MLEIDIGQVYGPASSPTRAQPTYSVNCSMLYRASAPESPWRTAKPALTPALSPLSISLTPGPSPLGRARGASRRRRDVRLLAAGWILSLLAGQALGAADLDWHTAAGCRWRELPSATSGKAGFTLLAPQQTGITFTNHLSDSLAAQNRVLENGSGVALGDVDGDGWCDIYFCRLEGANVLYRNLGTGKFEDVTQIADVASEGQFSTCAVSADIDGDGDLDLIVNTLGRGTHCFLNLGNGRFREVKGESGLRSQTGSLGLALAAIIWD